MHSMQIVESTIHVFQVEILPKDEQQTIYTLTKEGVPNDQNSRISGCTGSPTK